MPYDCLLNVDSCMNIQVFLIKWTMGALWKDFWDVTAVKEINKLGLDLRFRFRAKTN